jgi:serine/threonine protein kinase
VGVSVYQTLARRLAQIKNKQSDRLSKSNSLISWDAQVARHQEHGDGFAFIRKIGEGGFGSVWEVMHGGTGELLAAKRIKFYGDREDDKKVNAAVAEMNMMKHARHQHIVAVHGGWTDHVNNEVVMFMELVPGRSISDVLLSVGKFTEAVVRRYAKQILLGLAHMHKLDCVHRDIKGQNILLTTKGEVKIADFGGARFQKKKLGSGDNKKTEPDWADFLYTPRWAAPELINAAFSPKSDIWAFGCVILEMSSGKEPWYELDHLNWTGPMLLRHVGGNNVLPKFPSLSELGAQGQEFLRWSLSRDPNTRPSAEKLLLHPFITGDYSTSGQVELAHVNTQAENSQLDAIRNIINTDEKVKTLQLDCQMHTQQLEQQQLQGNRPAAAPAAAAAAAAAIAVPNRHMSPPAAVVYPDDSICTDSIVAASPIRFGGNNNPIEPAEFLRDSKLYTHSDAILRVGAPPGPTHQIPLPRVSLPIPSHTSVVDKSNGTVIYNGMESSFTADSDMFGSVSFGTSGSETSEQQQQQHQQKPFPWNMQHAQKNNGIFAQSR